MQRLVHSSTASLFLLSSMSIDFTKLKRKVTLKEFAMLTLFMVEYKFMVKNESEMSNCETDFNQ